MLTCYANQCLQCRIFFQFIDQRTHFNRLWACAENQHYFFHNMHASLFKPLQMINTRQMTNIVTIQDNLICQFFHIILNFIMLYHNDNDIHIVQEGI